MKTVGRFTLDGDSILGPAEYMRERGFAKLDEITSGCCVSFNMTCHLSPDLETAVLVALQTDYAGWKGMRDLCSRF